MDPPTACVPWHSSPIHSQQNMPSSIDLEQNVIYSDLYTLDELNINKSVKGNAFGTRIQIKEVPLPQVYQKVLHNVPSCPGAKGIRTMVVSSARWDATKHRPTVLRRQRTGVALDQPHAFSLQVNRLQEKQRAIEQCKALKQISQIVPHRVDRLYYTCGSHIPIQPKYEVDMAALRRLQMKRSSQETTTAQIGHKGLMCPDSEENEPSRSFETQAIGSDSQDNHHRKCCPSLTPIFMTESAEKCPEDVKGQFKAVFKKEIIITAQAVPIQIEDFQKSGKHKLRVKIDTAASANILPTLILKDMYLKKWESMTDHTRLTAYNGSPIKCIGMITLQCSFGSSEWQQQMFYIVDTTGPAFAGLPVCQHLRFVRIHEVSTAPKGTEGCNIECIESVRGMKLLYPDRFDAFSDFKGDAIFHVREDAIPSIDKPRKRSMHTQEHLKLKELDEMKCN
ncbi:uncharacterized protein [Heterodontus francisci]|uniref:uncharacterized protein n=1 Tax=Heterodontus francisci TaxID=7792 RepID=UPI00355B94D5